MYLDLCSSHRRMHLHHVGGVYLPTNPWSPLIDAVSNVCGFLLQGETGLLVSKITDLAPFVGYAQNKDQTERKKLCDVLKKGDLYFNSGDLMRIDEENFIYFQDRVGDTFRYRAPVKFVSSRIIVYNLTSRFKNPKPIESCDLPAPPGGKVRMWPRPRCRTSWPSVTVSKKPTFMESKCQVMLLSSVPFTTQGV